MSTNYSLGGVNTRVLSPIVQFQTFMPVIERLYCQDPESLPFRQPVDPTLLQIPDYFDVIERPMDLSTIKKKLENGQYCDPWLFVEDVWLMFSNAWRYNRRTSRVYRYCTKLSEVFESEIDPIMQRHGYCCCRSFANLDTDPFVECGSCGLKLHQRCVAHPIPPEGFRCDGCPEVVDR